MTYVLVACRAGLLSPVECRQFLYDDLLANVDAAKEIRLLGGGVPA